jgi:hypothetical protein
MQHFLTIFLSLLSISIYGNAESTAHSPENSYLSDVSDDDDDEDIIIMDEEDNEDEGVNN